MTNSQNPKQRHTKAPETEEAPVFELLEPRVLYSADALGVSSVFLPDETHASPTDYVSVDSVRDFESDIRSNSDASTDKDSQFDSPTDTNAQTIDIVFIDSRVPDSEVFINAWASPNVQFVVIDETDDALGVISQHLNNVSESAQSVSSLRIVSHGGDGFLQLGNANLDESALNDNAHLLAQWSDAMTGDADILLYGCDVAQSSVGLAFVETLATLTDADVAASDDPTGHAAQGGDWELEVSYGATQDFSTIDTQRMADWTNTLAPIVVSNDQDNNSFSILNGLPGIDASNVTIPDLIDPSNNIDPEDIQLRLAIVAANNTVGDDTILFEDGVGFLGDVTINLSSSIDINTNPNNGSLSIINSKNDNITLIGAGGASRIFTVESNSLSILGDDDGNADHIIFTNGRSHQGGAIQFLETGANHSLTLNLTRFENNDSSTNSPDSAGGAISSLGNVTIRNSHFENNEATEGGAIHMGNENSQLSIEDTTFRFNDAESRGGAIFTRADTSLIRTNFTGNEIEPGITTTLDNAGAVWSSGNLFIDQSEFNNNEAFESGAIRVTSNAVTFTVKNTDFFSNDAFNEGGAIYTNAQVTIIDNTEFLSNSVTSNDGRGGALIAKGSIELSNNTIFNNNLADQGSAIFAENSITINDSDFLNQRGGVAVFSNQDITINSSLFERQLTAGAVYTEGAAFVTSTEFLNNHITTSDDIGGGAIHAVGGVDVEGSRFTQNTALTWGGAILSGEFAIISNSSFVQNQAIGSNSGTVLSAGGAVVANNGGMITKSSFVNNVAEFGSAVYTKGDTQANNTMKIDNVTFSNNVADANPNSSREALGTVALDLDGGNGGLAVTSSTFADNMSESTTAGIFADPNLNATVSSSVFVNNTVSNAGTHRDITNVTSLGHNVSDEALTSNGTPEPNDVIDSSLMLEAAEFQNTPTGVAQIQARPLGQNSSAINAGSSIDNDTDIFGQLADGIPDAGALEFQGASDTIYWADEDGKIWRSNTDFTNPALIRDTGHNVSGLVVDLDGHSNNGEGRILWIDQTTGNVHSTLLDGSGASVIPTRYGNFDGPNFVPFNVNSLAFDPDRDLLFGSFSSTQFGGGIRVFEIFDSSSSFIGDIDFAGEIRLENPRDIHYSAATGRLYWVDGDPGSSAATIHSSNIDGSSHELIHTGTANDNFRGIVTDENGAFLFFTNQSDNTINRLDLSSNTITASTIVPNGGVGISNGINDITFASNDAEIIVTNPSTNQLHVYNDDLSPANVVHPHSVMPIVVTSVTTTPADEPTFSIENFHYVEGTQAQAINSSHISINNPSNSNITFELVSGPASGGVLNSDAGPLIAGNDFNLSQNITYFNDTIVDETSDVFQLQMFVDDVAVGPVRAFIITLTPIDDQATFTINSSNPTTVINENEISDPIAASLFDFMDEETGGTPDAYRVISNPINNFNLQVVVGEFDIDGNFVDETIIPGEFTHADLENGRVHLSTVGSVITPTNSTSPVIANLEIQAIVDGQTVFLGPGNINQAANWEVEITPVDDLPVLTANQTNFIVTEGIPGTAISSSAFQFNDEENEATGEPLNGFSALVLKESELPSAQGIVLEVVGAGGIPTAVPIDGSVSIGDLQAGNLRVSALNAVITDDVVRFYDLTFYGEDINGAMSNEVTLTIEVRPTNDAPTINPQIQMVNENDALELTSAMFNFDDEETPDNAIYTLTPASDTRGISFNVDGTIIPGNQTITFTQAQLDLGNVELITSEANILLGFPTEISYNIGITLDDANNTQVNFGVPLEFHITPVNDEAVLSFSSSGLTLFENQSEPLDTTLFDIDDEEMSEADFYTVETDLTGRPYTLKAPDISGNIVELSIGNTFTHDALVNGLVAIDATDADLAVMATDTIDFTVTLVDGTVAASALNEALSITVNPANDNPTVEPIPQQLQENTTLPLDVSMFGYSDEEGDSLSHFVFESFESLDTNNFGVTLTIDGQPLINDTIITPEQLQQELVVLDATAANIGLGDSVRLIFHAVDENGQRSESRTLSTLVLPENDAAVLTAQSNPIEIDEGDVIKLNTASFSLTDEEDAAITTYVIQALPDEPGVSIELNNMPLEVNSTFTQEDLDQERVTINASNAPVLQSSMDALNVSANLADGTQTNATDLLLEFNPIEDAPQLSTTTIISAPEDSTTFIRPEQFSFTDADGDTLKEYRLTSALSTNGFTLERDGVVLSPDDTFTQEDLEQELITIQSDGTNINTAVFDQFGVIAVSSNDGESEEVAVIVLLQPNDDAPVLSAGDAIIANENELTTLTTDHFTVDDPENDAATLFTLVSPMDASVGAITVNGQILNANQSFTLQQLAAGDVRIDLQALDINQDTQTNFGLTVTAGGQTSVPQTLSVLINEANDAPEFALEAPITVPMLAEGSVAALPENAFTDSDDDTLTYSAAVIDEQAGTTAPLPEWLFFDSVTREFVLIGEPTQRELNVVLIVSDPDNGQAQTVITLTFDEPPQLAAALPEFEPAELEVIETTTEITPTPVETAPVIETPPVEAEPEATEGSDDSTQLGENFDESQQITSDIESSRIDLADLLPSLNLDTGSERENGTDNQSTDRILSDLIGITNGIDGSDPFRISSFESQAYQASLDDLADRWDDEDESSEPILLDFDTKVGTSVGLSSGFTVGYLLWLVRGGTLMGSVLSSLPAWRLVDPLPVLAELDDDLDDDNESLESMVNKTNDEEANELSENQNAHS